MLFLLYLLPASDFEKVVKKTEVKEMAANKYAGTQIQGSR
jgi:hypothetical protein